MATPNETDTKPVDQTILEVPESEEFGVIDDEVLATSPPPQKPAAAAAPAATTPAATTPAPHPHSEILLRAAREVGIPENVIKLLPSDELLNHTLDLQRKMQYLATADTRRVQQPQQQQPQQVATLGKEESEDEVLDHLEREVGYDSKLIGIVRKMRKDQEEIRQMEHGRRLRDQDQASRRQVEIEEAVDDAMEILGEDAEDFVGKGALNQLKDQSQVAVRMAIYKNAGIQAGDSPKSVARKIRNAWLTAYGPVITKLKAAKVPAKANGYEETAKKSVNGKVGTDDWDEASLARPTGIPQKKTKSGRAAVDAITDRMREMGVGPGQNGDEFDGLPD